MSKGRKLFYWIVTGIFISLALSSMLFTRDGSLNQFYNDGYVQDLTEDWRNKAYLLGRYNAENETYQWLSGTDYSYIGGYNWKPEMNYLLVDAEIISGEGVTWRVSYRNKDATEVLAEDFLVQPGKQVIPMREIQCYRVLIILICNGDTQFKLNDIRFAEYEEQVADGNILIGSVLFFVGYGIISFLLYSYMQKRRKSEIRNNNLLKELKVLGDELLSYLDFQQNTKNYARYVRVILLVLVMVAWRLVNDFGVKIYYGYGVFSHMILFATLIAWIPKKRNLMCNLGVVGRAWLFLLGIQFVSDILVIKKWNFTGIWLLISFGLLFCAWSKMEKPEELLEDFLTAAEILYLISIVYCLVSRYNRNEYGQLDGTWGNPNPFSITVVTYVTIVLFRVYQKALKKTKWYGYWKEILELGFGIWMLTEAACRTAWITLAVVVLIFMISMLVKIIKIAPQKERGQKSSVCFLGILGLVLLGMIFFLYRKLYPLFTEGVMALSLNNISSGRLGIWSDYFKQMNLWGHDGLATSAGRTVYAHNGLLKVMYKYGIFAGVCTIVFIVESVVVVLKMWKKKAHEAYGPLIRGLMVAYLLPVSLEAVNEYPMVYFNWFAFYFVIGYIIQSQGNESGMMEYDKK